MNEYEQLILIKDKDKTKEIEYCTYDKLKEKYIVRYTNSTKSYSYNSCNVECIKADEVIHISKDIILYARDIPLWNVDKIIYFGHKAKVFYEKGYTNLYDKNVIKISKSVLNNKKSGDCFKYLKEIAKEIKMSKNEGEDEENFLGTLYEKIDFVNPDSVLADYLNPQKIEVRECDKKRIFPFGFNLSQKEAVEKALNSKISVIEGPPGTGKTQTIINIIANIIKERKTVAVVSNNNSAIQNVLDKLKKYDIDFMAAFLGNSENRETFFKNQTGRYPDFKSWRKSYDDIKKIKERFESEQDNILKLLKIQIEMAEVKENLSQLNLEAERFKDTYDRNIEHPLKFLGNVKADKLKELIFKYGDREIKNSFFTKVRNFLKYRIISFNFYSNDREIILNELRNAFYDLKVSELRKSIASSEKILKNKDFDSLVKEYSDNSMVLLKSSLIQRFQNKKACPIFELKTYKRDYENFISNYPIVLSTTHSLRNCIPNNFLFDYVIIDESSQVDLAAGALALSCAKNAVIVGDLKQLPNIVNDEFKKKCEKILKKYNLDSGYNYAENSLLSSIINIYKDVPRTLLKEHYRCSPKIIGFCNKKFYNDELVIMTKEKNNCPMSVIETVKGNHARGHKNQRQVDVIKQEILPEISEADIGIISPYRDQIRLIQNEIKYENIKIDTVHKFQGQENDVIILSTVANEVNKFIDDPNLINVAVSRAKDKFVLVTAKDDYENKDSNISDLIRYIKYNRGEVNESKINSIFDMLYKVNAEQLKKYLSNRENKSEYDSENVVDALLDDILNDYSSLDKVMHYQLDILIKDKSLLDEKEKAFVKCPYSHCDFIIFNKMDKSPVLVIEVDGTSYHADNPKQLERDRIKDRILNKYNIPCLRLATDGSGEDKKIRENLNSI